MALVLVALSGRASAQSATEAREHYRKALAAYDLGSFEAAAKEFEAAYAIKQDASLLYNIGQAYRFAKDSDKALLAYRAFLRRNPKAPQRAQVEQSIAELEKQIADERAQREEAEREAARKAAEPTIAVAPVVVVSAAPPKHTPVYKKWWLWTAVGGVVAIGLGVGLGVGLTRHETTGTLLPAVGGAQ